MSTAEKIEQTARIIDPEAWDADDDQMSPTERAMAEKRWTERRKASLKKASAILSLLQQGEPEGFRSLVYDYLELRGIPHQEEWVDGGDTFQKALAAHGKLLTMLSASPLPPAPVQGWRPIETAPKDGTKIITFAPDGGIEVSFYYADTLENGTAYETWRDDGCEPTHWMPLPPAPGAETGKKMDAK